MTTSTGRQTHCLSLNTTRFPVHARAKNRIGLTLIEILIALTMTLIVLGAMAQAFKFASGEIADGRAILELANRLRNAEQLLRRDLAGITVDVRPHTDSVPNGYFEYVDGPSIDRTSLEAGTGNGYLGDIDDIIAFTTRSLDGNFRGRHVTDTTNFANNTTLQSNFAEVIWFTEVQDLNSNGVVEFTDSLTLYRRVLLIRPDRNVDLGGGLFGLFSTTDPATANDYFKASDISATWVDSDGDGTRDTIVANSLQSLSRRENRFCRNSLPANFPHAMDRSLLAARRIDSANEAGDDVLLTSMAAFDVQIYSPNSPVDTSAGVALNPSDVGFSGSTATIGGFIDLASGLDTSASDRRIAINPQNLDIATYGFNLTASEFWTLPVTKSGLATQFPSMGTDVAFCTWSPHYENDGFNQDGDGATDEGLNGLDDDGINGVDDDGEKETSPPYPFAPRGIKATFRVIEKNTKQIRQTSVIHNFSKM